MELITSADIDGAATSLELEALALVQVARLLRLVAADRDELLERLREAGYPDPRPLEAGDRWRRPGALDPD